MPVLYLTRLRQKISKHYSEEELQTLCFDLGIDCADLPAQGKTNKIRELTAYLDKHGRIWELLNLCKEEYPNVTWPHRIFTAYKRRSTRDRVLATYLYQLLSKQGHEVFVDQTVRDDKDWLEEIEQQLKAAHFLILLLSHESADSEIVQEELQRAYNYQIRQEHPQFLLVRVAYEQLIPYPIDKYLAPTQYVFWSNEDDNQKISREILDAVDGKLPDREPYINTAPLADITFSEDGRLLSDSTLRPPLPEFDPRFLEELDPPGGTVRLHSKFYIERDADSQVRRQVVRPGSVITIRASRQSGKSSLMVRGIDYARQQGAGIVNLDLQRLHTDDFGSADVFLRYIAIFITRKLQLNYDKTNEFWRSSLSAQDKLTYFMEDYVLPKVNKSLVLAIDEVDRLLETDFHTSFFGLLRAWYNNAAYDDLWEKLNVVMVISTEPYLLVREVNLSPFNVGLILYLEDFSEDEIRELNQRHGSPIKPLNFSEFKTLLGGHPYLTRQALYTAVTERLSWSQFVTVAPMDTGPFGDHLRRQLWILRDDETLRIALKQVIQQNRCKDEIARFRLLRAGLIKGAGDWYTSRCDLYRIYFEDRL